MLPCTPGAFFSAQRSFWLVCLFSLFSTCVVLVRRTVNAALRFFFVENETCYMAPFSSVRALSLARLWTARFKIFPHVLVGCGTNTTNHDDHHHHHHLTSPPAEKGWTHGAGWRGGYRPLTFVEIKLLYVCGASGPAGNKAPTVSSQRSAAGHSC